MRGFSGRLFVLTITQLQKVAKQSPSTEQCRYIKGGLNAIKPSAVHNFFPRSAKFSSSSQCHMQIKVLIQLSFRQTLPATSAVTLLPMVGEASEYDVIGVDEGQFVSN